MTSNQQGKLLSTKTVCEILRLNELGYSQSRIANQCNLSRSTIQDYLRRARKECLSSQEAEVISEYNLFNYLGKSKVRKTRIPEEIDFEYVHQQMASGKQTLSSIWNQGKVERRWKSSYQNFCRRYKQWHSERDIKVFHYDKRAIENRKWMHKILEGKINISRYRANISHEILPENLKKLFQYVNTSKQQYRNRAIVILAYLNDIPIGTIADFLLAKSKTVRRYIDIYYAGGIEKLFDFSKSRLRGSKNTTRIREEIDFEHVHHELSGGNKTLTIIWQQGLVDKKWKSSYGNFCRRYKEWYKENDLKVFHRDTKSKENRKWMHELLLGKIQYYRFKSNAKSEIKSEDLKRLFQNIYNPKRQYRNRAIAILSYLNEIPNRTVADFLLAEPKTIRRYIEIYLSGGAEKLFDFTRNGLKKSEDPMYIDKVFEILHSPPSSHGINRTRWEMKHIHQLMREAGLPISQNNIRKIIRNAGYRFRLNRSS